MIVRDEVFKMLDAVVAKDWKKVDRTSRQVIGRAPPQQREVYARQWLAINGAAHPEVAKWIEEQIKENEQQREDERAPAWTSSRPVWLR